MWTKFTSDMKNSAQDKAVIVSWYQTSSVYVRRVMLFQSWRRIQTWWRTSSMRRRRSSSKRSAEVAVSSTGRLWVWATVKPSLVRNYSCSHFFNLLLQKFVFYWSLFIDQKKNQTQDEYQFASSCQRFQMFFFFSGDETEWKWKVFFFLDVVSS